MIRTLSLVALVTSALAVPSPVYCSQTLTLSLETPSLTSSAPGGQPTTATTAKTKADTNTVKVGRVGLVQSASAYIYKSKSPSSRRYATVKAETPLAIVREESEWFGVLMVNGAIGWIPSKHVRLIDYDLVAKRSSPTRGSTTSRGGQPERADRSAIGDGSDLVRTAMQYQGVRYVFGGNSPSTGMDCSAFVKMVFGQHGIRLPRTAREQANVGVTVPFDQLQPGDRLYFSCNNPYIDHTGIYAGNGYFVHCSRSRGGVGVDSLGSDFYWRTLVIAKRS